MKKLILKIALSVLCVFLISTSIYFIVRKMEFNDSGEITVQVINGNDIIKEKTIKYDEGDKLVSLIEDNFEGVLIENGMLLNIEGLETPVDTWDYFFWIKVNGEDATVGLESLILKDGDTLQLVFTKNEYTYENS